MDHDSLRLWRIGDFVFDPAARTLSQGQRSERLTVKAAEVLLRLARHADKVVSRERLISEVWDGNNYTGARALTYTIWQLRRALDRSAAEQPEDGKDDGATSAIETISKSGYRLRLPATPQSPPQPQPAIETTSTPSAASAPPALLTPTRRTLMFGLAAGLALSIGAGDLWLRRPPSDPERRPLRSLTTLDGIEDFPAYSPDGKRFAYTWHKDNQQSRLRVVERARPDHAVLELDDPQAPIARPVWVDDQHIAYERGLQADACRIIVVDLRSRQRSDVAGCYYQPGLPALTASPDGQWLAFVRRRPGRTIGIVLHHIADGKERVLTEPPAGFDDGSLAWSADGTRIAFLRGNDTVGDVYTADVVSGQETRLTHDSVPVWGLSWLAGDRALVYSGARDGGFAIWQVSADGGTPSLFSRTDSANSLAAIPDGSGDIAASVYRKSDHIESYDLDDGKQIASIASSGRDMFATACPDAAHPVFVSLRDGGLALWFLDGNDADARKLPLPAGTPEPASCAPHSGRYATTLRREGAVHDSIVIGDLATGEAPKIYDENSSVGSVTWGVDGRTLVLASDRGGNWDLWRFDPHSGSYARLTDDQGRFGREVLIGKQRWLYYTRLNVSGLWRRPIDDDGRPGAAERVLDDLAAEDWGNWQWHDGAVWRIRRDPAHDQLVRRDVNGSERVVLSLPPHSVRAYRSLSIDPNQHVLLTISGSGQADIMRIPAP